MLSVTRILRRAFPMNPDIPKHILENARQRGIKIHEWLDSYNKGEDHVVDMRYQQQVDNIKQWFEDYEVEVLESELKLKIPASENSKGLVGIIDMLCKTKEHDEVLVSLKVVNKVNLPYCELQESAYNELLLHNGIIEEKVPARVLHIRKSGYEYIELEDKYDLFVKLKELVEYIDER